MLTSLMLLGVPQDASAIVKKVEQRCRQEFAVEYTLKSNLFGAVKGNFGMRYQNGAYYKAAAGGETYTYVVRRDGGLEVEHSSKTYQELGAMTSLLFPESTLSRLSLKCVPHVLLGDVTRMFPAQSFKTVGKETMDGVSVTHVRSGSNSEGISIWVTDEGQVRRCHHIYAEATGVVDHDYRFSAYGAFKPETLTLKPPVGYRQATLKREAVPIQTGMRFDTSGWKAVKGLGKLNLSKATLLIVTTKDCNLTKSAAKMIGEIDRARPVIVLSDDGAPPGLESFARFRSTTVSVYDRVAVFGTPFFIVVDGNGIVKQVWVGFVEKQRAQLKTEILEALR